MNFNEQQLAAINHRGQNVLVFASAGGGKTTVLVNRLLKRIVDDHIDISNILALTFTENAALNMKKRLEKELKKQKTDPFIEKQIAALQTAQISTIHAFFLELFKSYYYLLDLPKMMAENILDEGHAQALFDEAFSEASCQFSDLPFLDQYLNASLFADDNLKAAVKKIINKARTRHEPLAWLKRIQDPKVNKLEDINTLIWEYYLSELKGQFKIAAFYLQKLAAVDSDHQEDLKKKSALINELLSLDDYQKFLEKCFVLMRSLPNKKDELFKYYRQELSDVFKTIAEKLMTPANILNSYNEAALIADKLIALSIKTYEILQKKKEDAKVMDFNDFEIYAWQILHCQNGRIAHKLQKQYQEIMIDEFQDTNDSQFAILKLISNNNLFIVGDIKQSIYRFRYAKPEIMAGLKNDPTYHKIHIRNNYRSAPHIVAFNNILFNKIMNLNDHLVDESDMQIPFKEDAEGKKVIMKLAFGEDEKASKAKLLANTVYELHQKGESFRSICILVETHEDKKLIRQYLNNYHIPYFIIDNASYFASSSLDVIAAYCRLLLDKDDRYAAVTVLSSPLYNLSDDELLRYRDNFMAYKPLKDDLYQMQKAVKDNRLGQIVGSILNINDYYRKYLDEKEKANVALFLENLDRYGFNTLSELVEYIDQSRDLKAENASTVAEDEDVVKVMTIHASKGLEFDNCLIYSSHRQQLKESSDNINVDEKLGLCLSYRKKANGLGQNTLKRAAFLAKENVADLLEDQRLLYVALTRAKNNLIIIDAFKNADELDKCRLPLDLGLFYARKGFTALILSAMGNDELLKLETYQSLEEYEPLKYAYAKKEKELPHGEYNIKAVEDISPSSLEEGRLELALDQGAAMDYGTRIHRVLELLDLQETVNENTILNIDQDLAPKALSSIMYFAQSPLIQEALKGKILKEFPFYLKEGNKLLHGFMDFVAILEDKIILIDYKSDAMNCPKEFIERYQNQLLAYQEVLEKVYHLPIESYIYALNLKEFIKIDK